MKIQRKIRFKMRKFLFSDREALINEKLRKSRLRWIGHVQKKAVR
jgi:hypothetical protein